MTMHRLSRGGAGGPWTDAEGEEGLLGLSLLAGEVH